ncbi:hypothetical protein HOU08_gp239 [Dickeya phage vB_DsoM_JA29]|uniref:Uncharacterized protein n=1 Tax=Dickeya phage vB_DsoM_JA29 TaxID=2283031 RepID=A0A384ZXM2_9CAUD|nr:hypothetical protein HOU08_gp239 [Dickeya phage vB_DsoM_JA29]AXG66965.1 hypothetical protein JA29_239 [Dickeya phage vB_DsoM_JA29]
MYSLNEIVQKIINRLPDVAEISNLEFVHKSGCDYVYFQLHGITYRVDAGLFVEEKEGSFLVSSSAARNVQAVLRGERETLINVEARNKAVDAIVNNASHIELQEVLIGIGEPEEGTLEELQKAVRDWLHGDSKLLIEKMEIVWLFFGHDKATAFNEAFR